MLVLFFYSICLFYGQATQWVIQPPSSSLALLQKSHVSRRKSWWHMATLTPAISPPRLSWGLGMATHLREGMLGRQPQRRGASGMLAGVSTSCWQMRQTCGTMLASPNWVSGRGTQLKSILPEFVLEGLLPRRTCWGRFPFQPGWGRCWALTVWPFHTWRSTAFVVVQSISCVRLFETPWAAARQASLSFTISQSLLKLMSTKSVMPSNHLILCHPLLLQPSIFPSIRVFSNTTFQKHQFFCIHPSLWPNTHIHTWLLEKP